MQEKYEHRSRYSPLDGSVHPQPPHKRIHLNRNNGVPLHLQLERHLEYLVCAGIYHEGELLPSIRFLAKFLGISAGTVRRTYARLSERGLVKPRQGQGVRVTWRPIGGEHGGIDIELRSILEGPIRRARMLGFSNEQVVRAALDLLTGYEGKVHAVFIGFNAYVAQRYARLLEDEFRDLGLKVTPIDLPSLQKRSSMALREVIGTPYMITQLYHLAEVEQLLNGMNAAIIPVVVTLSRVSHERLATLRVSGKGKIGVICPESMGPATLDAVATYFPLRKNLVVATPAESYRLQRIASSCEVVITNGVSEEEIRALVGSSLPIVPLIYVPTLESLNRLRIVFSRSLTHDSGERGLGEAAGQP